jgi:hypothetical protein
MLKLLYLFDDVALERVEYRFRLPVRRSCIMCRWFLDRTNDFGPALAIQGRREPYVHRYAAA